MAQAYLKGCGARLSSLCRILSGILATLRVEVLSITHVLQHVQPVRPEDAQGSGLPAPKAHKGLVACFLYCVSLFLGASAVEPAALTDSVHSQHAADATAAAWRPVAHGMAA